MKIDIRPNIDQIRFFARSAMHAWDYQGLESGRAQVIADMERLLHYLDAFNDGEGTVVAGVKAIKAGIRDERSPRCRRRQSKPRPACGSLGRAMTKHPQPSLISRGNSSWRGSSLGRS